jgi:hypothetical protein
MVLLCDAQALGLVVWKYPDQAPSRTMQLKCRKVVFIRDEHLGVNI